MRGLSRASLDLRSYAQVVIVQQAVGLIGLGSRSRRPTNVACAKNCRSELARDPLIFLVSTNILKSLVLILFKYFWL